MAARAQFLVQQAVRKTSPSTAWMGGELIQSANRRSPTLETPDRHMVQLQALVYDFLPPTTAITDDAIGLGKLSANGQVFLGVQTAVSL